LWTGVLFLGIGVALLLTVILAGPTPFGMNAFLGLVAVLLGAAVGTGVALALLVEHVPPARGARVVAALVAGVGFMLVLAVAFWFSFGDPATGTLTELVVAGIWPLGSALALAVVARRRLRQAVTAFAIAAVVVSLSLVAIGLT
jgi:hypothetical protein